MGSMAKVQYWDHFPATMDHSNPANAAENEYQWTEELYTCAGCGENGTAARNVPAPCTTCQSILTWTNL